MATINEDNDSWRAGGIQKRDFNQSHDGPEAPKPGKSKKKNTKKWCKGVVGREHNVQNVQIVEFNDKCMKNGRYEYIKRDGEIVSVPIRCGHWRHYALKCINCGKEYFHYSYGRKAGEITVPSGQQVLAKQWCGEGHLWDWEEFDLNEYNKKRGYYQAEVVIRHGDYMYETTYSGWRSAKIRVSQYCAMCGLKSGKTKRIYPGDTPWLSSN